MQVLFQTERLKLPYQYQTGLGGPPPGAFPPDFPPPSASSPPVKFPPVISHPCHYPPPVPTKSFSPAKFPSGIHAQPKRQKEAKRRPRMSSFIEKWNPPLLTDTQTKYKVVKQSA